MKEKLSPEENALLMEYLLNSRAEKTCHIGDVEFVIRSIVVNQQLAAQSSMKNFEGTQYQWAQELHLKLLACGLKSFNKKDFSNPEEAETFLRNASDQLVNKIGEAQSKFQLKIKALLDRADDFSESPSSSED